MKTPRLSATLVAAALALTGQRLSLEDVSAYQSDPNIPRARGPRKRTREEKRERAREERLRKGGVPGAGLWRKCGGKVRGW